jgi:hypothetical protein
MESSATLTIPRMFSDAAGRCRFDQIDISLEMKEYAPPAAPVAVSTPMQTGQCVFMRIPPRFVGVQHPSPQKQLVVCVSGAARFHGSDEETHVLRAGESLIDANTEGPGHVSEVISDVPFEAYLFALTCRPSI